MVCGIVLDDETVELLPTRSIEGPFNACQIAFCGLAIAKLFINLAAALLVRAKMRTPDTKLSRRLTIQHKRCQVSDNAAYVLSSQRCGRRLARDGTHRCQFWQAC